ncbi:HAD family hydrolase, partial [Streptomyces sp. NPDC055060]
GGGLHDKGRVRGVAIDYWEVVLAPGREHEGIAELLRWLDQRDVAWVLLTKDPMDAKSALAAAGLPEPALHLCRDDIPDKAKRGNKAWLEAVADRLGLRMNQLILIGTSQFDWYTSLHAGVVHIHARWASRLGAKITSLMSDEPSDVIELMEYFLLHEPRWAFRLDDEGRAFAIRSMLPFNARFPRGGGRTFTIKDIFTYENTVKVGDEDARDVLMLHLLCAAYLDGALPGQSFFCVYPSSTPAKGNPQLAGFLQRAKVMTGSSYKEASSTTSPPRASPWSGPAPSSARPEQHGSSH